MAWFRNQYECYRCDEKWQDEWSCQVDDECPTCGARHASPVKSEDLTFIIEDEGTCFVILKSPDEAGYYPEYREVTRFLRRDFAEAYIHAEPVNSIV